MVDDETAEPAREVAQRVIGEVRPYAEQLRAFAAAGINGLLGYLAERTRAI